MEIKNIKKDGIKSALELVWSVFQEFEAPFYTRQGINEFKKFIVFEEVVDRIEKGEMEFWGCYKENALAGVIAMLGEGPHLPFVC